MSELREECYKCLNNQKCVGCYQGFYCIANCKYDMTQIKERKVTEHHIKIRIEKLKELILENHINYDTLKLKDKKAIATRYAYFETDKDLLEFLEYMEE